MSAEVTPPRGLSRESRRRWVALHLASRFAAHEEIACETWLRLEDRGAALWAENKVAEAVKTLTLAWRWFAALRFTASSTTTKKLGRPVDVNWSPPRGLGRRAG